MWSAAVTAASKPFACQEYLVRVHSIADVASAVRGRRLDLGLTQSALAEQTGISRKWISEFEGAKTTVEFVLVMRVLEALDLRLELDPGYPAAATSPGTFTTGEPESPQNHVDLDALLEEHRKR
jgi:HTH-type transcriptional regulator/antitoxin HipB